MGGGILGQGEDVPGDVGAGDGLYGDPVADLNVPGERAIGQLDGPQRIPVEPAGGEFGFHRLEVLPDVAEVGDHHGAEEAEQQPRPDPHGVVSGAHAGGADRDQPGGCGGLFHRGDEGAGQPLVQVGRRGHGGAGVVAGGEVRANDGDDHAGAADGPGDDGGVEDVGGEEN